MNKNINTENGTLKTNPRGYKMSTGLVYENIMNHVDSNEKKAMFIKTCGITKSAILNSKVKIPYSVLPEILHNLNMSVMDMYAGIMKDDDLTQHEKEVINLIDAISDEQCQKLIELSKTFTVPWWCDIQQPNPKILFRTIVPKRIQVKNRRKVSPDGMSKQMISAIVHEDYQLSTEELIDCAKITDASLHWLLCLNENTTLYCQRGWGDMLYDTYKLLPEDIRPFLESSVRIMIQKGS